MPTQNIGEEKFKNWLDSKRYSFLYIEQSRETFPEFFRDNLKRPDFLVVINRVGLIAVDVKEKEPSFDRYGIKCFTLDEEREIKKFNLFETLTRIPVWFVFHSLSDNFTKQFWIPLSKVLECDKEQDADGKYFRIIQQSDCIIIQSNNSNESITKIIDS